MSDRYSFTDPDGDTLQVISRDGQPRIIVSDSCDGHSTGVTITPDEFPGVVAALHQAAGLPVPYLLAPDQVGDGWVHVTGTRGAA